MGNFRPKKSIMKNKFVIKDGIYVNGAFWCI